MLLELWGLLWPWWTTKPNSSNFFFNKNNLNFWYFFNSLSFFILYFSLFAVAVFESKKSVILSKTWWRCEKKESKLKIIHNRKKDYKNWIEIELKWSEEIMACYSSSSSAISSSLRITNSMAVKGVLSFPPTPSHLLPFNKAFTFVSLRASTKSPIKSFQGFFLFLFNFSIYYLLCFMFFFSLNKPSLVIFPLIYFLFL